MEAPGNLTWDGPHPPSSCTMTEYYYIPRVDRGESREYIASRFQLPLKSDLHDEGVLGVDGRGRSWRRNEVLRADASAVIASRKYDE